MNNKDINNDVDKNVDNQEAEIQSMKNQILEKLKEMGIDNAGLNHLPFKDLKHLYENFDEFMDVQDTDDYESTNPDENQVIDEDYDINIAHPTTDPDVINLRSKTPIEQLYFFLDDIVPKQNQDSSVLIMKKQMDNSNEIEFAPIPDSIEIFEQIANMPNHAAKMYPNMIKYFHDIIWLYNNVYSPKNNPYWEFKPLFEIPMETIPNFILAHEGKIKTFISLESKENSIPFRLFYGDSSHKNDFVGVVYIYFA